MDVRGGLHLSGRRGWKGGDGKERKKRWEKRGREEGKKEGGEKGRGGNE